MEKDRLEQMFELQSEFMELLKEHDRMPEWPVDLTSKSGQRLLKEVIYNTIEELMEASMTLRNKIHRLTDVRILDREHYVEELGDSFAYFLEICILSGITPEEIFQEYKKKNGTVKGRLIKGY